ncbi:septation ring formation regulator EzrA [Streptococcus entericus]|uniref:septation ring formation regulator EzrA n=1 Tax=Streptococcus entericus TaxID=155680 RepID=UPI00037317EC|nr:septation ring formation regulator EzrA [Streptococcus entericus]
MPIKQSGIILLIVAIILIAIVGYLVSVFVRRKNDGIIAELDKRKEGLMSQPVSDDIEAINQLQLVGQSQEEFDSWKERWAILTTETFKQLEEDIEEAEVFNDTFHFLKVKKSAEAIDAQLKETEAELSNIRQGLVTLKEQEEKNSARVKYALDLYEELQEGISSKESEFGPALTEINKQLSNIQTEFSQFVALNTSGDPLEAAEILERAEEHTIALGQISEKVPGLAKELQDRLADQLDDLETGYAKLLEENYHFGDQPIEQRFQTIREAITAGKNDLAGLELDKAEAGIEDIQARLDSLYELFEKEIAAQREVKRLIRRLPSYLEHVKTNHSKLQEEILRLQQYYILDDADSSTLKGLSRQIEKLEEGSLAHLDDSQLPEEPFSTLETRYSTAVKGLEGIEQEQLSLTTHLKEIDKKEVEARQLMEQSINRLHIIKRFIEKRHMPGVPQEFLSIFFTTSSQVEALMAELDRHRIDIQAVNRLTEASDSAMAKLEETAYTVVQYATLTEQLLQYSNRYRNFDKNVQASFEAALHYFEVEYDYRAAFDEISYALEIVEPGVTERFVTSYEKTREMIRF